MGVPKFFRYISERYPCLSELIREHQIGEFDHLYLDMNGIIHNCSHPDDGNVHFRITEEQIFLDIFHYIETLFGIIKPQKLFFLAIDGVAPRAKMNQQRGRRFRSAREAEVLEKKAMEKGETLPTTKRFDSNCITPGTEFMAKLHEALKQFLKNKVASNKLWQRCRVILSGHETPGEGEHKIMEYIRYLKSKSGYNPNTRHCLYGLDADLIMLGLCTHEVNISLLREEVKFGKQNKKNASVDDIRFFLLHLGLFKEYLDLEFNAVKNKLSFGYDIEKIVDDFILMSFMVGNDFIPHLPNLHIHADALSILCNAYMDILPTLDGYLNEDGTLNLERFEVFMTHLANLDRKLFEETYADLKYIDSKEKNNETFGVDNDDITEDFSMDLDLLDLIKNSEEAIGGNGDMDDDTMFECEFYSFKRNYYIKKLGYAEMTPEILTEQAECYITALQWNLYYYYYGIKSWKWYYPHHYAPFMSDINNFSNFKMKFDLGHPFLPFQQLLAVLPPASKDLLPVAYHRLMTDDTSSVIEYYPQDFETDLNGKKQEWEAVVLIPFIDEEKLLVAMKECEDGLTENERKRNIHGPMFQYDFVVQRNTTNVEANTNLEYSKETAVWRHEVDIPDEKIVLGVMKGALRDVYFPGFPTMRHLKFTGSPEAVRVRVFDNPSRNASMVIKIANHPDVDIRKLAGEFIGKEVYVDWPHLSQAKVEALSNDSIFIDKNGERDNDTRVFNQHVKQLKSHYDCRMAIDLNSIQILVHVNHCINHNYIPTSNGTMILNKIWSPISLVYPIQLIVSDIDAYSPKMKKIVKADEIFTRDSVVFMISTMYYGCLGTVLDPSLLQVNGRIQVLLTVKEEPDLTLATKKHAENKETYRSLYPSATAAGLTNSSFSRITGTVFIIHGAKRFPLPDDPPRTNIGLQLKFPKKNEEVYGYTKKVGTQYFYSQKAIKAVQEYYEKYPKLFELLQSEDMGEIFESDLFPEESNEKELDKLVGWLKSLPQFKIERRSCGTESLDEDVLEMILRGVDELKNRPHKSSKLQVKPFLLYKPNLNVRQTAPDPLAEYRLFDRVVCVNDLFAVPLGLKGTVIGIHKIHDPNPVRQSCLHENNSIYEVLFDKPFSEGISISSVPEKRVYKVSKANLLNISYGQSKFAKKVQNEPSTNHNQEKHKQVTTSFANFKTDSSEKTENYIKNEQLWNMLKKKDTQAIKDIINPFGNKESQTKQHPIPFESYSKLAPNITKVNSIQRSKGECIADGNSVNKVEAKSDKNLENTPATELLNALMQNSKSTSSANSEPKNERTFYNSTFVKNLKKQSQTNTDESVRHTSDALRKILRINSDDGKTEQPLYQNYTKVDVENLPKPPPTWRNHHSNETFAGNRPAMITSNPSNQPIQNIQPINAIFSLAASLSFNSQNLPMSNQPILHPPMPNPAFSVPPPPPQASFLQHHSIQHSQLHPVSYPRLQQCVVQPQPQQITMPVLNSSGYTMPMDYSRSMSMPHPHANYALNFSQMPYQPLAQRPNGPQHLNNNSSYSPGQGAFIPLQATKQQVKSKGNSSLVQRNLNGDFKAVQNVEITQKNTETISNDNVESNVEKVPKVRHVRPVRAQPSRLAARFGGPSN